MGWWRRLFGMGDKPRVEPRDGRPMPRSTYDAARAGDDDSRRHWANTDGYSSARANNPVARRTLRNRSRYEDANNGYFAGMVKTRANDIVGRGSTLQVRTEFPEANAFIEREYRAWRKAIGYVRKQRTHVKTKDRDGEAFTILASNRRLSTPVKLDLKNIEADQVTTPLHIIGVNGAVTDRFGNLIEFMADGILFDRWGNPIEYHILKNHPGDLYSLDPLSFDRVPAEFVIHSYDVDRPGQVRGIPLFTPTLNLGGAMRRFSYASLLNQETAANVTGVLETPAPADQDDEEGVEIPGLPVERNMLVTLPEGYKANAFTTNQPSTNFPQFKREILSEMGRPACMPYSVVACDSSDHNYASGRLDLQGHNADAAVEQFDLEETFEDRIFDAWIEEASQIAGYLPAGPDYTQPLPRQWFWQGTPHVDPVKEATAQEKKLQNNTTTLADEWASAGFNWETKLRQRKREKDLQRELGLDDGESLPSANPSPGPQNRVAQFDQPRGLDRRLDAIETHLAELHELLEGARS